MLAGESIIIDDKEFKNFRNYVGINNGVVGAPSVNPINIEVLPVTNINGIGILVKPFTFPQPNLFSIGPSTNRQFSFDFDVMVLDPNFRITKNTAFLAASTLSGSGSPATAVSLTQDVIDPMANPLVNAFIKFAPVGGTPFFLLDTLFAPQTQVTVHVLIQMNTDTGALELASMSSAEMTFMQEEIQELTIGGEIIPIETTSLLLSNTQSFSWMIPVLLSGIGIGLFVVSRKSE